MRYTDKENQLYVLFTKYRNGEIGEDFLIKNLADLCKGKGKKAYWWRYFEGDNQASDWMSVGASLNSFRNVAYLMECIDIALNEKSITVYYS
jgi:hypothetical protein